MTKILSHPVCYVTYIIRKTCTKCGETKPIDEFYRKGGSEKRRADCAACCRARRISYGETHKEQEKAYRDAWREANPEYAARWAADNAERLRELNASYYAANKDAFAARSIKWREENRGRAREIDLKCYRKRQATPRGRLDHSISAGVYASLAGTKSGNSTFDILEYSIDDLMGHLERKFTFGMTWENYGEWHVDHIIPKSAFKYESQFCDGFRAAWALTNLQPLWAEDNHSKHAKMDHPSQVHLLAANDNRLLRAA